MLSKFLKTIFLSQTSIFLGLVVLLFMFTASSCSYRYRYTNQEQVANIRQIYLLSVEIDDYSYLPKNQVIYYATSYVSDAFISSLIAEVNSYGNDNDVKIKLLDDAQLEGIYPFLISNNIALEPFTIDGVEKAIPVLVKGRWIKKNSALISTGNSMEGEIGYMTIQFKTSVWKQEAVGFLKVYNKNGLVVARVEIDDFSPYIVMDEDSPYAPKNKQLIDEKVNNNTHYYELTKVYRILGQKIAQKILNTLKIDK